MNSILHWNAVILKDFHQLLGNKEKAYYYQEIANKWMNAVMTVLWDEETGVWLDYDLENKIRRKYFYPSNVAPLWTECYPIADKEKIVRMVLKYLENEQLYVYEGGVPTTTEQTGEQWDYPNAWPPLQHMMIVGLENTGDDAAKKLALELAAKWLRSNYETYERTSAMFEKVNCNFIYNYFVC